MNNRISSVVASAMLLTLMSGCCCNMSSLWFGRGARCGLCNKLSGITQPKFGNVMQAPCGCQPFAAPAPTYQPAPAPAYQPAPAWQAPQCQMPTCQSAPAADCGCNSYAEPAYSQPCGTCHSSGYADCGCGTAVDGYHGNVVDPYLTGGSAVVDGVPMSGTSGYPRAPQPGEVINGETVVGPGYSGQIYDGGQVLPGTAVPGTVVPPTGSPVLPDGFQPRTQSVYPQGYEARKFDKDGNKILWEEPLPAGANAQ